MSPVRWDVRRTTAAAVSSHDVSSPRTTRSPAGADRGCSSGMGVCKYRQVHVALAFGPEALQTRPIRIGSRGSRLALIQANEARDRLLAAHGLAPEEVEIVTITTTGDRI